MEFHDLFISKNRPNPPSDTDTFQRNISAIFDHVTDVANTSDRDLGGGGGLGWTLLCSSLTTFNFVEWFRGIDALNIVFFFRNNVIMVQYRKST